MQAMGSSVGFVLSEVSFIHFSCFKQIYSSCMLILLGLELTTTNLQYYNSGQFFLFCDSHLEHLKCQLSTLEKLLWICKIDKISDCHFRVHIFTHVVVMEWTILLWQMGPYKLSIWWHMHIYIYIPFETSYFDVRQTWQFSCTDEWVCRWGKWTAWFLNWLM